MQTQQRASGVTVRLGQDKVERIVRIFRLGSGVAKSLVLNFDAFRGLYENRGLAVCRVAAGAVVVSQNVGWYYLLALA